MDDLRKILEDSGLWGQIVCAVVCWIVSHINVFTGMIAFLVAAYTFKTTWYKSKIEKLKYDKMVQKYRTIKDRRKK